MPLAQVVVNQTGPLPIQTQFKYQAQGPGMLFLSGTAWTQTAGVTIGFEVLIDGNSIGASEVFANESGSHKTTVTAFFPVDLDYGQHQLMVSLMGNAVSDANDVFNVSLLYY